METRQTTTERPGDHPGDVPRSERGQRLLPMTAGVLVLALATWGCSETGTSTTAADASAHRGQPMAPPADHSVFLDDVELRPGITADLHLRMFVNEDRPCRDPARTALAVHGINHTAATWERLADAFFTGPAREQLCAVGALDLPGHGDSGLPEGDPAFTFGQLTVQDYARGAVEVMQRLQGRGIRPSILMGHSQGTLTLQTVQQLLLEDGASLAERFDLRDVVFFGTQGPREAPVAFTLPDEAVAEQIAALLTTTEEKGTHLVGPPQVFRDLWFINRDLVLSSDAPTVEEIADEGWNADVPLAAVLQNVGQGGFRRPSVSGGAFARHAGTRLHMIHFTDDPWSVNAARVYEHLTDDPSLSGFTPVRDPDGEAVHDYPITDPGVVRSAVGLPRVGAERRR